MMDDVIDSVKKTVRYWWVSLLVGVLALIAGACCIITPVSSLLAITNVFIVIFILGGMFDIVFAISNRSNINGWGWSLAGGILELLLGLLLLAMPLPSVTAIFIYLIGFWMLFRSIMGIVESFELQSLKVKGWGWFLALSILCLVFSFIYLMSPVFGGLFVTIYIGISLIFYGIYRIMLAFRLRKINQEIN